MGGADAGDPSFCSHTRDLSEARRPAMVLSRPAMKPTTRATLGRWPTDLSALSTALTCRLVQRAQHVVLRDEQQIVARGGQRSRIGLVHTSCASASAGADGRVLRHDEKVQGTGRQLRLLDGAEGHAPGPLKGTGRGNFFPLHGRLRRDHGNLCAQPREQTPTYCGY